MKKTYIGSKTVVGSGNVANAGEIGLLKKSFTEVQFREQIRELSKRFGYLFYFTHRSQFSPSGFPDCVLVRLEPIPRILFAELKTDDLKHSQPSVDQWMWLYILQQLPAPVECYLWRPSDFDAVVEALR